ncbi:hypothetical protein FB567DRAFT_581517 [Paraphoma chrysanthemicola]|uniref:Heterokaryon incompatibility domain-containing protein n=1 Tax=Paraphoma chrysanthemicola TaxID=798071 RepID=A0A8K0VVM9_9PLEO|nr:hypothetical protein FB567DRAFT_581517 [Paraphoma chrysanthemicola]
MYLIRSDEDGNFSLVEYVDNIAPRYAILSHTWGPYKEEVSFRDLRNGLGKSTRGYEKIRFCAERAAKDGLQWFWIDTCCIDQSKSQDLQTAVNSMFRWYQNAAKCYVYLSDVQVVVGADPIQWKSAFRTSRWFTRGWTLQELIAPPLVEFFSSEGTYLGSKESLEQEIHDITGVPVQALRGTPLSNFSIDERLAWATKRETTFAEDAVYSLLGIFGVFMPLIYGEGRKHAMERLGREILPTECDDSGKRVGLEHRDLNLGGLPNRLGRISLADETNTEVGDMLDTDSDADSDVASIFSDGTVSSSSASTVSQNPVQTIGIREVTRALLSHEELKAAYTIAVHEVGRQKARAHIRGFLKSYGRDLRKEATDETLESQAAMFVHELAGRIADEITWSITGFQEMRLSLHLDTKAARKDLETWLSSLQAQSVRVGEGSNLAAGDVDVFDEAESDEEHGENLVFPNIDRVKGFLLQSHAFEHLVIAMQNWLRIDKDRHREADQPAYKTLVPTDIHKARDGAMNESVAFESGDHRKGFDAERSPELEPDPQQVITEHPESTFRPRQNRDSFRDLSQSLLDFWGLSFFFYDLVELFVPRIRPGYERLRWRCSCNTVLWGDFSTDDEDAFDQLRRELLGGKRLSNQQAPLDNVSRSRPNANQSTDGSGTNDTAPQQSTEPTSGLAGMQSAGLRTQSPTSGAADANSTAAHIINVTFSPRFFEVCVNIGNYAIDHHEIDISKISSDGELFELIWDKYKCSRSFGLRRLFLRPRDVHFVMFSVNRRSQYGAGIHKRPDEFPPQEELDGNRYHFLCPKIRMPVNVFLHYLHRARWNVWGEHAEDTWLQRLPKKLNESMLAEWRQNNAITQQHGGEAIGDSNLAFGWGVHILDGPNHAALGILIAIGITVAFVVSGMVVGFAKTQEQGFAVGSFLLAILASVMAAVYFQLQDL